MNFVDYIKSFFSAKWRMLRRIEEFMQREDLQRFQVDLLGEDIYFENSQFNTGITDSGAYICTEQYYLRAVCGIGITHILDNSSGKV